MHKIGYRVTKQQLLMPTPPGMLVEIITWVKFVSISK